MINFFWQMLRVKIFFDLRNFSDLLSIWGCNIGFMPAESKLNCLNLSCIKNFATGLLQKFAKHTNVILVVIFNLKSDYLHYLGNRKWDFVNNLIPSCSSLHFINDVIINR